MKYTTIQSLIGQSVAVHCPTEAEANEFLKMVFSIGQMKPHKMKSMECAWNTYGKVVCISLHGGYGDAGYSPVAYYKEQGYAIITFSEFTNKTQSYTPEEIEFIDRCAIAAMQAELTNHITNDGITGYLPEKEAEEYEARCSAYYRFAVAMLKAKQQLLTNK